MTVRYVHWQEGDVWLGYLEEFPDYWTQGVSLEDLQEHLRGPVQGSDFRGNPERASSCRARTRMRRRELIRRLPRWEKNR